MAKAIRANGAPVSVDWIAGGHDGGDLETARVEARDRRLVRPLPQGRQGRRHRPRLPRHPDRRRRLHRRRGADARRERDDLPRPDERAAQDRPDRPASRRFDNPAGAGPPAISAVPGLGGGRPLPALLARRRRLPRLPRPVRPLRLRPARRTTCGSPARRRSRVHVKSTSDDAVLFAQGVRRRPPDGSSRCCPRQLVAPSASTAPRQGKDVDDHPARRRPRGRGGPPAAPRPRRDRPRLRLTGRARHVHRLPRRSDLTVPTAPGVTTAAAALPAWVWGLPAAGRGLAAALLLLTAAGAPRHPRPRPGAGRRTAADHRADQAVREVRRPVRRARPVLPRREGPGARPPRPERRGQDDHPAHADGPHHARRGRDPRLRARDPPRCARAVPGRRLRRGRGLPAAPVGPRQPGAVLAGHRAAPPRTPTSRRPWRSPGSATRWPARCAPTPRACGSGSPSPRPCSACRTC